MILFNYSQLNRGTFITNTLFLWYITADGRYFTCFNCLYVTPRTLCCNNSNNLSCKSTCYKTNNNGARKWIFLMPQMTITRVSVWSWEVGVGLWHFTIIGIIKKQAHHYDQCEIIYLNNFCVSKIRTKKSTVLISRDLFNTNWVNFT